MAKSKGKKENFQSVQIIFQRMADEDSVASNDVSKFALHVRETRCDAVEKVLRDPTEAVEKEKEKERV